MDVVSDSSCLTGNLNFLNCVKLKVITNCSLLVTTTCDIMVSRSLLVTMYFGPQMILLYQHSPSLSASILIPDNLCIFAGFACIHIPSHFAAWGAQFSACSIWAFCSTVLSLAQTKLFYSHCQCKSSITNLSWLTSTAGKKEKTQFKKKKKKTREREGWGSPLAVQWLELCASDAGGMGWLPGGRTCHVGCPKIERRFGRSPCDSSEPGAGGWEDVGKAG